MQRYRAFTLIELLVVIAIIAILAAIAFPVFVRTKDSAYRSSDISNMNAIRNALQLYRVDQGGYPPALLGYVTLYTTGPQTGQVVPANQIKGFLFPKRMESLEPLRPAYVRFPNNATTNANWPSADPRAVGSAAILDLNGSGAVDGADDLPCARQAFGAGQTVLENPADNSSLPANFYRISGYDVAVVPDPSGTNAKINEIHYALFWTSWGLGVNGCSLGNGQDDPRQLGYFDPPDTTIVTWNSNFRDYNGNSLNHVNRDVVLFLGGGARTYDSREISERSWRNLPK